MKNTYTGFSTQETPQNEPIPGSDQVENSAGGFSYELDKWGKLERFLILGTEGGTYYISQDKLTKDNALNVLECIKEDGKRVVDLIVDISDSGRAPKNDPALFALAMASGEGDTETRKYALAHLNDVARIFTHLSHFLTYVQQFRGWGRLLREAVSDWYLDKDESYLAYQMVKYRQRDGWTHADALRLAHPKPDTGMRNLLFGYAVDKATLRDFPADSDAGIIVGYERAKYAENVSEVVPIIEKYGLTREMIPTQFLNEPEVWEALFNDGNMPTWALLRNLSTMSSCGFLSSGNFDVIDSVTEALTNEERLQKARMHPFKILVGMKTYARGKNDWGSSWEVVTPVVDALNSAFYKAFDNVEPTGKRLMLGVDVSSSMNGTYDSNLNRMNLTPVEVAGTMSLVTASVEPRTIIKGFAGSGWGRDTELRDLNISPRQRLDDAVRRIKKMNFGSTDCALPMVWALENRVEVDAFVIYTDSETWVGNIHPTQALDEYRRKMNIPAKLVVVAAESNPFSIADPDDAGMLDVVGMDTSVPTLISDFIRE